MYYGVKAPKTDVRDYKIKCGTVNVSSFEIDDLPQLKNQHFVNS